MLGDLCMSLEQLKNTNNSYTLTVLIHAKSNGFIREKLRSTKQLHLTSKRMNRRHESWSCILLSPHLCPHRTPGHDLVKRNHLRIMSNMCQGMQMWRSRIFTPGIREYACSSQEPMIENPTSKVDRSSEVGRVAA